jgi:hypothetical protein
MLFAMWGKRMAAPTIVVLIVVVIALAGCGNSTGGQSESSPPISREAYRLF